MSSVRVEHLTGGISRIALSRPDKMNAMNRPMIDEAIAAVEAALPDAGCRAIILTGDGGNFSAGGDIAFLKTLDAATGRDYHARAQHLLRLLAEAGKPLIAAVEGACAGGGAGLILACDYVVMGHGAKYGVPFLRIGLVPDMGSAFLLQRRVGGQQARRLIFEGRLLSGDEALTLGIADFATDDAAVQDKALALAAMCAALPPRALARTKWLLGPTGRNVAEFLEDELDIQSQCFDDPEFAEGLTAFLEKRAPKF